MDKIQINISSPVLVKLKALSRRWDKSASEIIRLAIERLIDQVPGDIELTGKTPNKFKTFDLGEIAVPAAEMRELLTKR